MTLTVSNNAAESRMEKTINLLLSASVIFLPTYPMVSLVVWVGLLFFATFRYGFTSFRSNILSYRFYLLMISLYIMYVLGMFWTEHLNLGFEDLSVKVPLVLFPFLFITLPINKISYKKIRLAQIYGVGISVLILIARACYMYYTTGEIQSFYYTSFSYFLHPTYFTMYLNLTALFLIQILFETSPDEKKKRLLVQLAFLLCLSIVVITNSRLSMLTVVATVTFYTVFESFKRDFLKKNLFKYILFVFLMAGLFQFLVQGYNRFDQIKEVIERKEYQTSTIDTLNDSQYNSTITRIVLLENGLKMFKDHWIAGVGTGDIMPKTTEYLQNSGYTYIAHKYAVPHNQYLQTAVTLGIAGGVIFISMLLLPLFEFWQRKEYLFFAFIVIVVANAVGETVLRASSLYFFSFFGCYFYKLFKTEHQ